MVPNQTLRNCIVNTEPESLAGEHLPASEASRNMPGQVVFDMTIVVTFPRSDRILPVNFENQSSAFGVCGSACIIVVHRYFDTIV